MKVLGIVSIVLSSLAAVLSVSSFICSHSADKKSFY